MFPTMYKIKQLESAWPAHTKSHCSDRRRKSLRWSLQPRGRLHWEKVQRNSLKLELTRVNWGHIQIRPQKIKPIKRQTSSTNIQTTAARGLDYMDSIMAAAKGNCSPALWWLRDHRRVPPTVFPLNAASRRGDPLTPNFLQSPRNKPIKGLGQQANTSITYSNKEHVARSSNTSSASLLSFLISPSVRQESWPLFAYYSELNNDLLMWPLTMKWLAGFWHIFLYLERLDCPLTSEIRVVCFFSLHPTN